MRRSGSSSCMLLPKSLIEDSAPTERLSVTLINTKMMPTYSTERFYMLSEIEEHAFSIRYLSSFDCDVTRETTESTDSVEDGTNVFPPFQILYLLWKPSEFSSPNSFVAGNIQKAVETLQGLVTLSLDCEIEDSKADGSVSRVYLVVDKLVLNEDNDNEIDNIGRERRFNEGVKDVEELARLVASCEKLRSLLVGVTVGLSNHPRAAPGLESCLNAITFGSKDRRKWHGKKSSIGLLSDHRQDLLGIDEGGETDAVGGVLQSCSCAEWNGNGNIQSFARKSHKYWRGIHNVPSTPEAAATKNRQGLMGDEEDRLFHEMDGEVVATQMIWILAAFVGCYFWHMHGEDIQQLLSKFPFQ